MLAETAPRPTAKNGASLNDEGSSQSVFATRGHGAAGGKAQASAAWHLNLCIALAVAILPAGCPHSQPQSDDGGRVDAGVEGDDRGARTTDAAVLPDAEAHSDGPEGGGDVGATTVGQCLSGNACISSCTRECGSAGHAGLVSCACSAGRLFCGICRQMDPPWPDDAGRSDGGRADGHSCPRGVVGGERCSDPGDICEADADAARRYCFCGNGAPGKNASWFCPP